MDTNKILTPFFTLILALLSLLPLAVQAEHEVDWAKRLAAQLEAVDAVYPGELGVFVKDLESGETFSFRGDERWYLASGVKVPVAIAVMRAIERGALSLDSKVELLASDYVDGAGETNWHPPGTALSVRYLLDQMLIHSDNTASDMLIRVVGLDQVNTVAQELAPEGFGTITTLADVRRHAYSSFHEKAFQLSGEDFFILKKIRDEHERVEQLAHLLGVPVSDFPVQDLDTAFNAYYATDLNAARLSAYATLLEALVDGRALQPESTQYLLGVMQRVRTGTHRIKAGLPETVSFAHKTGTQRARACDFGVARTAPEEGAKRVLIAACSRGMLSLTRAERALRAVGEAVEASGVLQGSASEFNEGERKAT